MRFLSTIHVQICATYTTVIPSRKEITQTKQWENGVYGAWESRPYSKILIEIIIIYWI